MFRCTCDFCYRGGIMKFTILYLLSFIVLIIGQPKAQAGRGDRYFCPRFIFAEIQLIKDRISTVWHTDFDDSKNDKRLYVKRSSIQKNKNGVYIRCDYPFSKTHYKYLKSKSYAKCLKEKRKHRYRCKN